MKQWLVFTAFLLGVGLYVVPSSAQRINGVSRTDTLTLGTTTAGGTITTNGDGAFTFQGLGDGTDECFTIDLDDTSNVATWSSTCGVVTHYFPGMTLLASRQGHAVQSVTVDGATTFAVTADYIVLNCTGAETINTITGGVQGDRLLIDHGDTECTIADDDAAVAANAVDLTGVATNDIGAVSKIIVLYYNGVYWLQVSESDN